MVPNLEESYRDWRFKTNCAQLSGQYFDDWYPVDDTHQWSLERAYFQLFRMKSRSDSSEFVALHCDPDEDLVNGEPWHSYKKGPHIHVRAADAPLPRAHLALADGYLSEVLQDLDGLEISLQRGINLIRHEIIGRMPEN